MPSDLFNVFAGNRTKVTRRNKHEPSSREKTAGLPANVFEDDAAKGLGTIGQEDLALPFKNPWTTFTRS